MKGQDYSFTTLSHEEHNLKRKAMIGFYTPFNLNNYQDRIMVNINRLGKVISQIQGGESIEVINMLKHLFTDITFTMITAHDVGSVTAWSQGKQGRETRLIEYFLRKGTLAARVVPSFLWKFLRPLPIDRLQVFMNSDQLLLETIAPEVNKAIDGAQQSETTESAEPKLENLIEFLVRHRKEMTDNDILSEVAGHMVGGVGTTSLVTTYALYLLATPITTGRDGTMSSTTNYYQEKIHSELSALIHSRGTASDGGEPQPASQPKFQDIDSLPYLDAYLKETLRLFGAGPGIHPRIVPPGKGFEVQGMWIPEGTEIGSQFWSMHRDPSVWERAEEFIPERWLPAGMGGFSPEPGSETYNKVKHYYTPFGHGPRMCAGKNLAPMLVKLILTTLIRDFEIKRDTKETNESTMEPRDSDTFLFPRAMECKLIMVPRSRDA